MQRRGLWPFHKPKFWNLKTLQSTSSTISSNWTSTSLPPAFTSLSAATPTNQNPTGATASSTSTPAAPALSASNSPSPWLDLTSSRPRGKSNSSNLPCREASVSTETQLHDICHSIGYSYLHKMRDFRIRPPQQSLRTASHAQQSPLERVIKLPET